MLGAIGIAVSSFYFVVWYGARTRILEAVARSQVRLVVERWQRSSRMAEYVILCLEVRSCSRSPILNCSLLRWRVISKHYEAFKGLDISFSDGLYSR